MIRVLLAACISVLGAAVARADVGIGVSVRSDDATIYVPVATSKRFMVEPYVHYSRQRSRPELGQPIGATTAEASTIGVGIFRTAVPAENFSIYYGGRLAHTRERNVVLTSDFNTGAVSAVNRVDIDGETVAPTLGFQYHILKHLTIGAEVAVEYSDLELKSTTEMPPGVPAEELGALLKSTHTETATNIILRFLF